MRTITLAAVIAVTTAIATCGGNGKTETKASPSPSVDASGLATDDEKALYAMGHNIGKGNFSRLHPSEAEAVAFTKGLSDGMRGVEPKIDLATQDPKIQAFLEARGKQQAARMKEKGLEFQKTAAAEAGAAQLPSGVVFRTVSPGTGRSPSRTETVKVNYVGTFVDGSQFDSSAKQGGPATFPLGGVVPCFSEGISRMKVGEKARLVCPPATAYGDEDKGPIPGGSTLIFDVELLEIVAGGKAAAGAR